MTAIVRSVLAAFVALLSVAAVAPVLADEQKFDFGGDRYAAGQTVSPAGGATGDVFAAGYDVTVSGLVGGNSHLAGFNVTQSGEVTGSLYAIGYSVSAKAPIGGSVTAFGNNVTLDAAATIGGNARLGGMTVNLLSPVAGSVLVSAETLKLDSVISGDLAFTGRSVEFGPNAKVTGKMQIFAPAEVPVPSEVAGADRVQYTQVTPAEATRVTTETAVFASHEAGGWMWGAFGWWVALIVFGLIAIAIAPRFTSAIETVSTTRFWSTLGVGLLALCALVGLVPVLAITVIGLLLVPFALLFDAIVIIGAYVAGAYLALRRLSQGFLKVENNWARLGVLVVAILLAGILSHVPILGWLLGPVLTLYGLGVLVRNRFGSAQPPATALPAAAPTAAPPAA